MFANRFTALIDACSLASAPKRDLLLSLAEAEFFRPRWSAFILDETQQAIEKILVAKGFAQEDVAVKAARAREAMERAFPEANVLDFGSFLRACQALPDEDDKHVLAAALATRADVIVTENVRHFPAGVLEPLGLYVKTADEFIADTIELDQGRAVSAIRRMRERYRKPEIDAAKLLLAMEAHGLIMTVDALRPYEDSL